jgi:hypothetical protein
MNGKDKEGIAFGDAVRMSSPPNRSQIEANSESGFGGWADEKIKTAREAAPLLGRVKKIHPQHLTISLKKIIYTALLRTEKQIADRIR